jgi:hypothetical protein
MRSDTKLTEKGLLSVLLFGMALAVMLSACGYKTLPVPPQQMVPKPITDLNYELSDKGVTLSWSFPTETVTGEDLTELDTFEVFRAVVAVDDYCETCPIPYGQPISIAGGGVPRKGSRTGNYETTLLRQGHLYFFMVRSRSGWWAESADSNIVSFLWDKPPATPGKVTVNEHDGRISLKWSVVDTYLDGGKLAVPIQYQVYRSVGGSGFTPLGAPVADTQVVDSDVKNGRQYLYRVQAVAVHGQGTVGGGMSEPVAATPQDQTPPEAPTGVRAVPTGVGVKIIWNALEEGGVTAYRVYRRVGSGKPNLVGETSAEYTLIVDKKSPETTEAVYYTVTAVDGNGNESKPSGETELRK